MIRSTIALAALLLSSGCFAPKFVDGEIRCTQDSACPPDYHCATATQTCFQNGRDPMPMPDLGGVPFTDDTVTCKSDGDCPSGGYCSLVGTCFHQNSAPARCPKLALFCDDFEGRARLPWGAAVAGGFVAPPAGASLLVDGSNPFPGTGSAPFGAHSLHAIAPGTPQMPNPSVYWTHWPYQLPTPIVAAANPATIAIRGYVFAANKFHEQPYFFHIHSQGNADGFDIGSVSGSDTANATWSMYNKRAGSYTFYDPNSQAIAPGKWYCVEVVVSLQSAGGTLTNVTDFYIDNVLINHTSASAPGANTTLDELDVGISWSQSSAANEYYIDDIAVATQRIFCE
jgi:hypothetical protein